MPSKNGKTYLKSFLRIAPFSHALWRSIEALSFGSIKLKDPVLDLGCGFGEFSGVVFGKIEMGTDINRSELEHALEGKRYKKVKWADARKLPFKTGSYSTVVSVSVLEHIESSNKVITEVYRVLKRGGVFAFSVPTINIKKNLLGYKIFGDGYFKFHSKAFKHVNLHSEKWWTKELESAGFEIVQMHGTLSSISLILHELFLISALPSQFWKLFFGERLIMSVGLRSNILPLIFSRFVKTDKDSKINIFFVAKKP